MNVSTITMSPEAARAKMEAYRGQLRRRSDEEYEAALAGYEALAEGTPLLNLTEAFIQTGLGEDGRPKLAIARADRKQVDVTVFPNSLQFSTLVPGRSRWNYQGDLLITIPYPNTRQNQKIGYALVPMVPADVRPKGNLRDLLILWEVERWADRRLVAQPDRDPYLLRHLGGDLYAVVVEWDLTDLERAIMTGRRAG